MYFRSTSINAIINLEILKYSIKCGCPVNDSLSKVIFLLGDLSILRYWHKNLGGELNKNISKYIASSGNLKCLRYARANGYSWDEQTCSAAASNGHIKCLIYLHENRCLWSKTTTSSAAWNGQNF